VIAPVLIDLGERWHRGEISVVAEHFATHYLRRKLDSLVSLTPIHTESPTIVLGCAPGDWHEIGLVLLSFYLRRHGYHVIYLGQNVPLEHLVTELSRLHPVLLIMSAATAETAHNLAEVAHTVAALPEPRPAFGYGGRAFNKQPELRTMVAGQFLGESAVDAIERVRTLVHQASRQRTTARAAAYEA
jgi:methanogenic corrinoid protein MtbC1